MREALKWKGLGLCFGSHVCASVAPHLEKPGGAPTFTEPWAHPPTNDMAMSGVGCWHPCFLRRSRECQSGTQMPKYENPWFVFPYEGPSPLIVFPSLLSSVSPLFHNHHSGVTSGDHARQHTPSAPAKPGILWGCISQQPWGLLCPER